MSFKKNFEELNKSSQPSYMYNVIASIVTMPSESTCTLILQIEKSFPDVHVSTGVEKNTSTSLLIDLSENSDYLVVDQHDN